MRQILLVSTALVGLTLLGFPAQAKSSFWSKEKAVDIFGDMARFGHAVVNRFKHKPQMQNNINDNLVNKKTDVSLREWVFPLNLQEPIRTSGTSRCIGAEGLRNIFGGEPDHNVLMDSLGSVAVAEAQYLVDNHQKPPLMDDVWSDNKFNPVHASHYTLMPTTVTVTATTTITQPYREVEGSKDLFKQLPPFKNSSGAISLKEAQYLSDSQLKRVLREVWNGQLNEDD